MMTDFIFLGSKSLRIVTSVRKIKRCLLPGKKAVTNLGSVLKIKESTLLTKVCIVKVILFPVVLYRCESWTIKKAECQEVMLSNGGAGEHSFESPLDSKEIKPINPKGNPP